MGEIIIDPATLPHHRWLNSGAASVALDPAYPDGALIAPHHHPMSQLLYAIEGVMLVQSTHVRWLVPPGCGAWLVADEEHSVRMCGNVQMRTVFFSPTLCEGLPMTSGVLSISALLHALILSAVQLRHKPQWSERDQRLMLLLLDELRLATILPFSLPWPKDPLFEQLCQPFMHHPEGLASVEASARQLGLTVKTFQRRFQRDTQLTWGRWCQQLRLINAMERLGRGDKIIEVAFDLGYATPSAFSSMFKKQTGLTPRHFARAPNSFHSDEPR